MKTILKWLAKAIDWVVWFGLDCLVRPTVVRLSAIASKNTNNNNAFIAYTASAGQIVLFMPLIICAILFTPFIMWEGWRKFQALESSTHSRQDFHHQVPSTKPVDVNWKQEGF